MPSSNAVAPENFERLLGDAAGSRAAWTGVRERLGKDPGSVAEPLCAFLLEVLERGRSVAVQASILPALEVSTRERPELLPAALLDRLLARAADLDTLSVVCLGLMRVRTDAEGLITDGIQEILAATEHALAPPQDDDLREVREYARDIAVELWETVSERDPTALVVVLEFWTAANGWDRATTRLFVDLLLRVAPQRPDVRESLTEALVSVRDALAAGGGDPSPIDRTLDELRELEQRVRRRAVAVSIAAGLAPAGSDGRGAADDGPPARAAEPLDPAVARWKEDYLSDDPDRSLTAREPLGPAATEPSAAMVAGVVQAAEELFGVDPWDDRFGPLVHFLCRTAESTPDLVPSTVLERWTHAESLEGWEQAMVYATIAQIEPGAIVARSLDGALGAAAAAGGGFGSAILTGVGRADPGLLVEFARRWLDVEGWTPDFGPAIACAFEQVARERPDRRAEMIDLLRAHIVPKPSGGDGFTEISRCIDRMARMTPAGRA